MMTEEIDPDFLKPFVEGTLNAMKVSCETNLSARAPYFEGSKPQPGFDIIGVIAQ